MKRIKNHITIPDKQSKPTYVDLTVTYHNGKKKQHRTFKAYTLLQKVIFDEGLIRQIDVSYGIETGNL